MTDEDMVTLVEFFARLLKASEPNRAHLVEGEKQRIVAEIRGEHQS